MSNIGDVASSSSAVNPIVEGHAMKEYYLRNPYKGTGKGYAADGVNGGPVDGMIRTESDMEWLKAMIEEGYTFMPNKTVKKDKIWYGDYVYADENGDGIYGGADVKCSKVCRATRNTTSVFSYLPLGKGSTCL